MRVRPAHYKESFEATLISPLTGQMDLLPFSFDYSPTPRIWLGYESACGAGIRAMYWQFDHHAECAHRDACSGQRGPS